MNKYEEPIMVVIKFEETDVIVTSLQDGGTGSGGSGSYDQWITG